MTYYQGITLDAAVFTADYFQGKATTRNQIPVLRILDGDIKGARLALAV